MFDLLTRVARVGDNCYIYLLYIDSHSSDSPEPITIYATKLCVKYDVQSFRILIVQCITWSPCHQFMYSTVLVPCHQS